MPAKTSFDPIRDTNRTQKIFLLIFVFVLFTTLFLKFPPQAFDFHNTFYPVTFNPLQPYIHEGFNYPPWTALILYPLSFFPEELSLAINASLGMTLVGLLVIKRGGGRLALLLTLTSFPFLSMLANGTVEWIPTLGFLLQNQFGVPLLLAKPQTGFLAFLAWAPDLKKTARMLIPAAFTVLLSFVVWGNWPLKVWVNLQAIQNTPERFFTWNIAPFPWAIPVGLGLIYFILKKRPSQAELLGVLATICLVPYLTVYSLTIPLALLSASRRNLAILAWVLLWLYAFWLNWGYLLQVFNIK
jgi:hypothetical protein